MVFVKLFCCIFCSAAEGGGGAYPNGEVAAVYEAVARGPQKRSCRSFK